VTAAAADDPGGSTVPPPVEQLALVRTKVRAARTAGPPAPDPPAARLPVARVALDVPQAHLDRPFDYAVTASQSEAARPGVRVRVRFAGREVGGLLLERPRRRRTPAR
jgi:primosomal protein N' (replication factor Y)